VKFARETPAVGHLLSVAGGIALIALLLLLPDFWTPEPGSEDVIAAFRGRIESLGTTSPAPGEEAPPVDIAKVRALEGARAGELLDAYMLAPGGAQVEGTYQPGDEVVVTITEGPDGTPFVAVSDRWRLPWLQILGLLFAAAVIAIGGWQGLRALVALGLTVAVIVKILLPLLIVGVAPVPLAVVTAAVVTVVTILLTEGWRRSSLAAILGTTAALALTGLLGAAATSVMDFTYAAGSDLAFLATQGGQGLDLRGILLAAFILGAVGVLDDVTVTQAAVVEELAHTGGLTGRTLFGRAMGVGRSHIAATVNTLFMAYVGAGLPLLVVLIVSQQPTALVANQEVIATEIARTLVGSLGIVAAVPFTTFIGAVLASEAPDPQPGWSRSQSGSRPMLAVVAAGVAAMLVATAVLPLGGDRRAPSREQVFVPGSSFDEPTSSFDMPTDELPTESPIADRGDPLLLELEEPMAISLDGVDVGTVSVDNVTKQSEGVPSNMERVAISVRYDAKAPFDLRAGTWELLLSDGSEIPIEPREGRDAIESTLDAGDSLVVTLDGELRRDELDPFVVFVDRLTNRMIFAVSLA
jgi:uncharacterized membrane protein